MDSADLCRIVTSPKLYLIGRKALADHPEKIKEALRVTPVEGTFVCSELDAQLAQAICPNIMGFHNPFALVADFPFELATIQEGGKLVELPLPEVSVDPEDQPTETLIDKSQIQ